MKSVSDSVGDFLKSVSAFLVALAGLVALGLLFTFPQMELRDIGEPCRGHNGVRQYVPPSFPSQSRPLKGIVVCRDGKVGEVEL